MRGQGCSHPRECHLIVAKLRNALVESLDNPQTQARLVALGAVIPNPEERAAPYLAQLVRDEIPRWGKVIKDAGIQASQ
jgi:tripartite-type tricarboxylate transporter receptor subunit TctC